MVRAKAKAKRKKLSKEERAERRQQSAHKKLVRDSFCDIGFSRIPDLVDKEFTYSGTTSDFDDVFVWENVIVFSEYTIKKNGHSEHLKKKYFLYNKINSGQSEFYEFMLSISADLKKSISEKYDKSKIHIRFIYCTTTDPDDSLKGQMPDVRFFDYPIAMYFKALAASIKLSARHEMLEFLGVEFEDAGENCHSTSGISRDPFRGSVLPESHSNLGEGYKVVSFYISPEALLERAYVLRKEGWRDSDWLYQRLISPKKIENIRGFLNSKGRVFLNNIIVTLPHNVKIVDDDDNTIDYSVISKTTPVNIQIPREYNTIGLIDGQHRVFSYHEGGKNDHRISALRKRLNLLVTGIMYPPNLSDVDRIRFEAEIFLEINSNQASAKSDLKQAISSITTPYDSTSVAKRVLNKLNKSGALSDLFVKYFYDKTRMKTTSVISYGIKHLVQVTPDGPLFSRWTNSKKDSLISSHDDTAVLNEYVDYCFSEIARWFRFVKEGMDPSQWDIKDKEGSGVLNTTIVIGFLNYFRLCLVNGIEMDDEKYRNALSGIDKFSYTSYRSSQYGAMARALYEGHFRSV